MLRNIPNKIDQAMLKSILDETSHGQYDFMYLRIDFANNCNVGYAFINFTDALSIIPFAIARSGQRWNRFNSDKVAEISYASEYLSIVVIGLSLTSVSQQSKAKTVSYRSSETRLSCWSTQLSDQRYVHGFQSFCFASADTLQLYITGPSSDAGQEEKFPAPDNPSKMRRSVENAEHVGLYKPTKFSPRKSSPRSYKGARSHRAQWQAPARARACLPLAYSLAPADGDDPFIEHTRPFRPSGNPHTFHIHIGPCKCSMLMSTSSGLFAPRQGQAYREEQRRRQSQYDRGIPTAEYETFGQRLIDPALSPVRARQHVRYAYSATPGAGPMGYRRD